MVDTCPPECKVKINGINQNITELKETDKKQWEVFDQKIHDVESQVIERVKTKTLIALFGVIVSVFLVIMAMTFTTLSGGQKEAVNELKRTNYEMNSIQREVTKLATQLETHMDRSDRDSTR